MAGEPPTLETHHPHIVIVGAGFAGLAAAHALKDAQARITIIDRRNYHLFQPLLYQVATASLSPADIAQPVRSILKDQRNTSVLLGEVVGVDKIVKEVRLADGRRIAYDTLILATGARHSYFGKDQWADYAPGIKSIDDATKVRANILLAFERAEVEFNPERRKALLTFAVIGGGPTGVEMAGAIAELARNSITRDFRSITPHCARVLLVEAGPRLLPAMPEALSEESKRALNRLGVEVRLGKAVTNITRDSVTIGDEYVGTKTIVWAAGVRASAAGQWLESATDRAGRVFVGPDFSVPNHREIFVVGDTAAFRQSNDTFLPGVAPAAKQAGAFVGSLLAARLAGRPEPRPFVYRDFGNMATIGRRNAVADFGRVHLKGLVGWLLWSLAHVYFLIGFRNRLSVAMSWAWSYVTYQRGVRLITGRDMDIATPLEEAA
ncbi:MAG TPA: NAD(P)/FAD-dependent oxidoreductase [Rhizomicrobium sp.]|nr:NAD(P)/FAD-dependent oxidoreductase [Rhizomicrobium sp.]